MVKKPRYLTKSKFKTALDCPSKLYYYGKDEYASLNDDNEFLQALCEGGYQVGELAKYYYPGGYDIKSLGYEESLAETNELLKLDSVIIYEAAICFENTFIRVDILKKEEQRIELIEVKAKSIKNREDLYAKRGGFIDRSWFPYLADVAFQTWVMQHALPGHNIVPYLMLADKTKVSTVDGLNQLFRLHKDEQDRLIVTPAKVITPEVLGDKILTQIDVSEPVQKIFAGTEFDEKKKSVEELKSFVDRIHEYADYYVTDKQYPVAIGKKCKACEYKNTNQLDKKSGFDECWREKLSADFDPDVPHVFDIWNFKKSAELIDQKIYTLEQLYASPERDNYLNERQMMQVEKTVTGDNHEFIAPELRNEMNSWTFPLHFIDFETSMVAMPFTQGRKPYEQTAFQFSAHTLHKDGKIDHQEWIDEKVGVFPNFEFVRQLKAVLDKDQGTIFRYAAHENTVLRQIQDQMLSNDEAKYGDLIEWIDEITEYRIDNHKVHGARNMVDMLQLVRTHYYHPDMKGSNSIKYVLPAIMAAGEAIKDKYSNPLEFGTHLKGSILYELDEELNKPRNPYSLLPSQYDDLDLSQDEMIFKDAEIQQGGAALIAYGKLQFTDMSDIERQALLKALLQYCELDTLAMVMIYEHWDSVI